MPPPRERDPYLALRFQVEIEGLIVGGFSEVSGLELELDTEEYVEGGLNDFVHALPKAVKSGRVVLQRGVTSSDTLWKWQSDVRSGAIRRHTVRILVLDERGQEARDWRCSDALPVKWSGPHLNASADGVAVERLELVHRGIRSGG